MIRRLITWPYRLWLRLDLAWIRDLMADAEARHARHDATMRSLRAEESRLMAKISPAKRSYGLVSMRLRRDA
jgi:hypothetical protein